MDEVNPITLVFVGGSGILFSRLFYHYYQQKKQQIQQIEEIPKYQPSEDLLQAVKAAPQKRLAYAAVEGLVQPLDEPLASNYIPRCYGVIQKVRVVETWEVWNPRSQTWFRRKRDSNKSNNSVPFLLVSSGASASRVTVKVHSPLDAAGSYLEQVHYKIKHAKDGLVTFLLQELGGERPFSMEETEEMLRVGTKLTGFGEVVLDQGRMLRLQPPINGQQYLLFPSSYKGFLQMHQNTATTWKVLTVLFGFLGATLIAWTLYRSYQRSQRKRGRN